MPRSACSLILSRSERWASPLPPTPVQQFDRGVDETELDDPESTPDSSCASMCTCGACDSCNQNARAHARGHIHTACDSCDDRVARAMLLCCRSLTRTELWEEPVAVDMTLAVGLPAALGTREAVASKPATALCVKLPLAPSSLATESAPEENGLVSAAWPMRVMPSCRRPSSSAEGEIGRSAAGLSAELAC